MFPGKKPAVTQAPQGKPASPKRKAPAKPGPPKHVRGSHRERLVNLLELCGACDSKTLAVVVKRTVACVSSDLAWLAKHGKIERWSECTRTRPMKPAVYAPKRKADQPEEPR